MKKFIYLNNKTILNLKDIFIYHNIINYFKLNFIAKKAIGLIHKNYFTNLKSLFTASTKTKKEIAGGGKKPWRQKGTGKARAGSIRSPLWVGGGVIFGPKPRKICKKINKKENKLAIISAFYLKENKIKIVSSNFFKNIENKTKNLAFKLNIFKEFKKKKKILIITSEIKSLFLASKNLKNINISSPNSINLASILNTSLIIFPINDFYLYFCRYDII